MRHLARIDHITEHLCAAWGPSSDLRLGQLLLNALLPDVRPRQSGDPADGDRVAAATERALLFAEDDVWEHALAAVRPAVIG